MMSIGQFGGLGAAPVAPTAGPAPMSGVPASIGQMPLSPSGPAPQLAVGPAPMRHVGLPFSGRF